MAARLRGRAQQSAPLRTEVVEKRLKALDAKGACVEITGRELHVSRPALPDEKLEQVKHSLEMPGALEIRNVLEDQPSGFVRAAEKDLPEKEQEAAALSAAAAINGGLLPFLRLRATRDLKHEPGATECGRA